MSSNGRDRQASHRFWEGVGGNRNRTWLLHRVKLRRERTGELAPVGEVFAIEV